jgi:hypothetical protein
MQLLNAVSLGFRFDKSVVTAESMTAFACMSFGGKMAVAQALEYLRRKNMVRHLRDEATH